MDTIPAIPTDCLGLFEMEMRSPETLSSLPESVESGRWKVLPLCPMTTNGLMMGMSFTECESCVETSFANV